MDHHAEKTSSPTIDLKNNFIESMSVITQAYWDYIDLKHAKNPRRYPKIGLKMFMIKEMNIDSKYVNDYIKRYNRYQKNLPTSGVLMYYRDQLTNEIYFIIVQINSVKMWSMPKGKHNETESSLDAGPREFKEETGIDTTDHIDSNTPVKVFNRTTFFIIEADSKVDVSKYKTREISGVRWVQTTEVLNNNQYGKYSKQVQMAAEYLTEQFKNSSLG